MTSTISRDEPSRAFSVRVETRKGVIRSNVDADSIVIIDADPIQRDNPDGSTSISVGFPVLLVSGWVAEPEQFAAKVAALLQGARL